MCCACWNSTNLWIMFLLISLPLVLLSLTFLHWYSPDNFALITLSIHFPAKQLDKTQSANCYAPAGSGWRDKLGEFRRTFRWSAGAGLVVPTFLGRFEANYAVVLSHQRHDRLKSGMQFGFATSSFL